MVEKGGARARDELPRQISLPGPVLHLYQPQVGLYSCWTVFAAVSFGAVFFARHGGDLLYEGGTKSGWHLCLCSFVTTADSDHFHATAWYHCIDCRNFWCLYGECLYNFGVSFNILRSVLKFQRSIFIVNICVWTFFYVIVLMVFGVFLAIWQLFYPKSEYYIAIILFDLLMFGKLCLSSTGGWFWLTFGFVFLVFLNYFFLILNSYYHYLVGVLNAQREACYATLRRSMAPVPVTPPEERIYDTLDSA